jgi:hypothetical protein
MLKSPKPKPKPKPKPNYPRQYEVVSSASTFRTQAARKLSLLKTTEHANSLFTEVK